MRLIIMRHAEAINQADDFTRALTPRGLEQAAAQAAKLKTYLEREQLTFDYLLSSDLTRAKQTAEVIRIELDQSIEALALKAFRPESTPQSAFNALSVYEGSNVLLVSHMPLVSYLDHWLCLDSLRDFALAQMQLYDVSLLLKGEAVRLQVGF